MSDPENEWLDVTTQAEFGSGQARRVEPPGTEAIAVFNLDGCYYAVEDICTHEDSPLLGCGLDLEEVLDGDQLVCPRHGARFLIRTGEALTPPAYEPLPCHPVRVRDGRVQVRIRPEPD